MGFYASLVAMKVNNVSLSTGLVSFMCNKLHIMWVVVWLLNVSCSLLDFKLPTLSEA